MKNQKGSCYSRPKRGRRIRALKTGEWDDKVMNMQASHLVCLIWEQGHNPSFLRSGLVQREWKEEKLSLGGLGSAAFLQEGRSWRASSAIWDLCPSYTFINKTSLSTEAWLLILSWYRFFSILLFYGTVSSPLWLKCQKNWNLASVHITLCLTWLWNLTKVLQEYYKVGCGTSLSTHKSNATKVLQHFKKQKNDTVNVFKLFILFCTRWF